MLQINEISIKTSLYYARLLLSNSIIKVQKINVRMFVIIKFKPKIIKKTMLYRQHKNRLI